MGHLQGPHPVNGPNMRPHGFRTCAMSIFHRVDHCGLQLGKTVPCFTLHTSCHVELNLCYQIWDSTKGFPGEGQKEPILQTRIVSANCTCWNTMLQSLNANQFADTDLIAVQEHRLAQAAIPKAQKDALALGWRSICSQSVQTEKG